MELVLRFLDRENEMVHRECWVESSSASPPKLGSISAVSRVRSLILTAAGNRAYAKVWCVKEEKQDDMRLIIEPKENYSLCCEKETTKENFFPKPPQMCHLLWVARSSSPRLQLCTLSWFTEMSVTQQSCQTGIKSCATYENTSA